MMHSSEKSFTYLKKEDKTGFENNVERSDVANANKVTTPTDSIHPKSRQGGLQKALQAGALFQHGTAGLNHAARSKAKKRNQIGTGVPRNWKGQCQTTRLEQEFRNHRNVEKEDLLP
ncbi:hypothetical protein TNCV_523581 [Trichonephila clavipes]|nr:hypothetical protein TNCV_523581 [Trichonephila clavipes]